MKVRLLALMMTAVAVTPALGGVYKCPQPDGKTIYQQAPCMDGQKFHILRSPTPVNSTSTFANTQTLEGDNTEDQSPEGVPDRGQLRPEERAILEAAQRMIEHLTQQRQNCLDNTASCR